VLKRDAVAADANEAVAEERLRWRALKPKPKLRVLLPNRLWQVAELLMSIAAILLTLKIGNYCCCCSRRADDDAEDEEAVADCLAAYCR
jgi:hypothetical protein